MIPKTFHHFNSKEEKDLVGFLSEREYWNLRRNGLFTILGISQLQQFKPVSELTLKNLVVDKETTELFKQIDQKIANMKSCKLDGGCE